MTFFKRIAPAIALYFLSPLIAEFLLGDFPLSKLAFLLFLAPFYGGGAVLIREIVRRTGRGWPTIITLALAYGIFEEAFTTQTLFNPDYLGLHLHLLEPAFIPALGISAWWTIFVLTLHTVWSISVPIAIMEALVPQRAHTPWLKWLGLSIVTVLFVLIACTMTVHQIQTDAHHFMASNKQFAVSAVCCVVVAIAAFLLPRRGRARRPGNPPSAWITGALSLVASSIFLIVPQRWGWGTVAIYIAVDLLMIIAVTAWSRLVGWNGLHILSLGGGAALAYAWHAFIQQPVTGKADAAMRIGNAVLALGTILLLYAAARRTSAAQAETTAVHA
ncbi:hypothetical protein [Occallatibacter riparius]|uniref:Uncharacterized protein n=1 Tax=Occallatibacter riparius TaxID=1002689 RepID=A0A9J7BQ84_9BACT|nr:hypothetical protein [Occallatibacter riparius]UWZ84947.1 hypothetical protein MOP44_03165 [Occallatibacter riparius]